MVYNAPVERPVSKKVSHHKNPWRKITKQTSSLDISALKNFCMPPVLKVSASVKNGVELLKVGERSLFVALLGREGLAKLELRRKESEALKVRKSFSSRLLYKLRRAENYLFETDQLFDCVSEERQRDLLELSVKYRVSKEAGLLPMFIDKLQGTLIGSKLCNMANNIVIDPGEVAQSASAEADIRFGNNSLKISVKQSSFDKSQLASGVISKSLESFIHDLDSLQLHLVDNPLGFCRELVRLMDRQQVTTNACDEADAVDALREHEVYGEDNSTYIVPTVLTISNQGKESEKIDRKEISENPQGLAIRIFQQLAQGYDMQQTLSKVIGNVSRSDSGYRQEFHKVYDTLFNHLSDHVKLRFNEEQGVITSLEVLNKDTGIQEKINLKNHLLRVADLNFPYEQEGLLEYSDLIDLMDRLAEQAQVREVLKESFEYPNQGVSSELMIYDDVELKTDSAIDDVQATTLTTAQEDSVSLEIVGVETEQKFINVIAPSISREEELSVFNQILETDSIPAPGKMSKRNWKKWRSVAINKIAEFKAKQRIAARNEIATTFTDHSASIKLEQINPIARQIAGIN